MPCQAGAENVFGAFCLKKYIAGSLFLISVCALQAQQNLVTGQASRAVFGQTTFTVANTLPSQQILGGVSGLAYANGILFVADSNTIAAAPQDNRVLMFDTTNIPDAHADLTTNYTPPSSSCYLCGFKAVNSLGQPTFDPPAANTPPCNAQAQQFCPGTSNDPTQPQMQTPTAVATDGHYVAVADTNNNRVLIWNSIPSAMNQPPNIVLGQSSFTTNSTPTVPTASSLRGPQGVWIQNGKLYVADTQSSRILIWNSIPTSNNQPADMVLGQTNFTTGTHSTCAPSHSPVSTNAGEFCNPVSVTSDGTHLFVADLGFNRVLIWNSIPTSNGQPADVVIGQPDMHSVAPNFTNALCPGATPNASGEYPPCASTLDTPRYALSDGTRLFVADGGNDRVLIFNHIPTANGAAADEVLGQPNMTTNVVTSQSISIASTAIDNTGAVDIVPSPMSLAYDGKNLYVSDPYNRRVLVFTPGDTPLPDNSIVNWASEIIRQEGVVTINANTIVAGDTVTVTIAGKAYPYTVKSGDTSDGITQAVVNKINENGGDPNAAAIFAGPGTHTLYLSSKGINLGYDTISLSATASNQTDIAVTASGAYLTAGTAATGAPGMLVEINGTNLSDAPSGNPALADMSGALPTTLGGAQVYMDGIPAPILSASATQIVSVIPFNFTDRNSTSIYVRTVHSNGSVTVTNASPVYIAPANPGLFNSPSFPGEPRPWPAAGATHQSGNPTAVVSIDGTAHAGDQVTITVNGRPYQYTVASNDSLSTIVANLVININNAKDPQVTAYVGAAFNRVVILARQPGAAGSGIPISGSASSNAQVTVTAYTSSTCCDVVPNSPITPSNPAVPGELINVRAAGLGTVQDTGGNVIGVTTGSPYNGSQTNTATASVSATLGGTTAEVVSAGLTQGSYGVYQVQLIVPSGAATNVATQLYIAQNAYISNTITLPVGPAGGSLSAPVSGVTFSASPNPIPWSAGNTGSTTLSWSGAPGNVIIYSGIPSSGAPQAGTGGSSGTLTVNNVAEGTTFYLQDATNSLPTSSSATLATLRIHISAPIMINFDNPTSSSGALSGTVDASGWIVDLSSPVTGATVLVDGATMGAATQFARPDVCAAFPKAAGCSSGNINLGWSYSLDTTLLTNGTHNLQITATDTAGAHASKSIPITVANPINAPNSTAVMIDTPGGGNPSFQGATVFSGWALNPNPGATIAGVSVSVDGVFYGTANYHLNRADVCGVYSSPDCPGVGWSILVDTSTLSNGTHTLGVTATAANGQRTTASAGFTVANWSGANPTTINIDNPGSQSGAFSGTTTFWGWAVNNSGPILYLTAAIDGVPYGSVNYGTNRQDVCNAYPGHAGCPNVGWNLSVDTTRFSDGTHTLAITAFAAGAQSSTVTTSFRVSNLTASSPIHFMVDTPGSQDNTVSGLTQFLGWALSDDDTISSVKISIDGVPFGTATAFARPDVCAVYTNRPGCPNAGWSLPVDTTMFTNGTHTGQLTITSSKGEQVTGSFTFTVSNSTQGGPVRAMIDQPSGSSNPLQGIAFASGWALSDNAQVTSVQVLVDGVPAGAATYGQTRPDVCSAFPGRPYCAAGVGWSYLLDSTTIPDGTHTLAIRVTAADGTYGTATSTFSVGNWSAPDPMRIVIDAPNAQSGNLFGAVVFGGWILDQNAPIVAVKVLVDGAPFGSASYGVSRPDVCTAFPGGFGCPNVGWSASVDTTLLSNGTHTLTVTGITPSGQSATAATTFTVAN